MGRVIHVASWVIPHAARDAFVAACADGRETLLSARGCRSVELEAGDGLEIALRTVWRSDDDRRAYERSDAAKAVAARLEPYGPPRERVLTPVDLPPAPREGSDPAVLRKLFAHYPTGVAVVAAAGPSGPVGMVVTSFAPVSLAPPLVAFSAAHTSSTWPIVADARFCCVNVLSEAQAELSRQLASKTGDRFANVAWSAAPSGAPILGGVVGWMDCRIVETRAAGDHDVVLLEILAHATSPATGEPLVFHRSAYRRFAPG